MKNPLGFVIHFALCVINLRKAPHLKFIWFCFQAGYISQVTFPYPYCQITYKKNHLKEGQESPLTYMILTI